MSTFVANTNSLSRALSPLFGIAITMVALLFTVAAPADSSGRPLCKTELQKSALLSLLSRIDDLDLVFFVDIARINADMPWATIEVENKKGEKIGIIDLKQLDDFPFSASGRPRFVTHIFLEAPDAKKPSPYKGMGIGTALYAMGAAVVAELRGELYSSERPSQDAKNAWERMVKAGWAFDLRPPDGASEIYVKGFEKLGSRPFRMRQGLIDSGFFSEVLTRVGRLDELSAIYDWIERTRQPQFNR